MSSVRISFNLSREVPMPQRDFDSLITENFPGMSIPNLALPITQIIINKPIKGKATVQIVSGTKDTNVEGSSATNNKSLLQKIIDAITKE